MTKIVKFSHRLCCQEL